MKDDEYNRSIYYHGDSLGLDAKSSVSGYKLPQELELQKMSCSAALFPMDCHLQPFQIR